MKDDSVSEGIEAIVTDIRLESRVGAVARWQLALDRAVFMHLQTFPPASPIGVLKAVAKSGARLEVAVLELIEEDGVVWCVVEKPLLEGTAVRAHPDASR